MGRYLLVSELASIGQRRYIEQKISILNELGFEVELLSIAGRRIQYTPELVAKSVLGRTQVLSSIENRPPDVLELYCPASYISHPISLITKIPTILSFDSPASLNFTGTGSSIIKSLEGDRLRSSGAVVSLTGYGAVEAINGYGVASRKVFRIPYAMPSLLLPRNESEGNLFGGYALSYCAGDKPYLKGLDILIKAWGMADRDLPLVVTGIPERKAKTFLGKLGVPIPPNVIFPGVLSRETYISLQKGMEFCVSPSRQEEFGQTLIEAFALGKPIAATPTFGPREIVNEVYPHTMASSFSPEDLVNAIAIAHKVARDSRTQKQITKRMWRYRWDRVKNNLKKCTQVAMGTD